MTTEILGFPSDRPGAANPTPGLTPSPVLVGCSHGTDDPVGRAAVAALLHDVRSTRPGLTVREAFVDVQEPRVSQVLGDVLGVVGGDGSSGDVRAVVVPLLLSAGYHARVDIAATVADFDAATATGPLGPDPRLVDILVDRLAEVGLRDEDAVVLAAAGSSDPAAARDVEKTAAALRERHPGPVTVGFGAMAAPALPDAVAWARARAPRVVAASYLLAPGHFHDRVREAGADVVTAPLAPDPRLATIVLDRYEAALRQS